MTSKADEARAVVEAVGKRFPDAIRLARAVSLASRVEPELLRKVRLELLPELDAGAEADLWFSPLVQSSTPLAFTFLPAIADQLRRDLAESRDSLACAWQVVSDVHEHAPAAIKLEERVTWTILNGGPTAHDEVEKDLNSVVSAILTQNRTGLARWALRAVPRLPVEARQTKAAQTLLVTAAAHLGAWNLLQKQVENNNLPATFINDLKVVLPSNLPQVEVGVRLLDAGVELGLGASASQSWIVEFSNPPLSEQSDLIRVPGTVPLLLEVSWNENEVRQVKQLSLYRGRVETIKVGNAPVMIRTARGDVYTLSQDRPADDTAAFDSRTAALERIPKAPQIGYVRRRFPQSYDIVEELIQRLEPRRVRSAQIGIIGAEGVGKTTVAAEVARKLIRPYEGRVVWLSAESHSSFNLTAVLDRVASQLGRPDLRTLSLKAKTDQVQSLLSARATMIFLDDLETVAPEDLRRCINFLKRCECSYVIISSRRFPMRRQDLITLTSMSVEEAEEFLRRIIRRMPESQTLRSTSLARLHEVSEGNPLTMELLTSLIAFVGHSTYVFDGMLEGKDPHPLSRAFDLSFTSTGSIARSALLATALFAPSGSKTAIADVAGFGQDLNEAEEGIKTLRRLRLAYELNDGERAAVNGFVRASVQRRQPQREGSEVKGRFIAYFCKYAEEHTEATSADYDALETEFRNLLHAIDYSWQLRQWNDVVRLYVALNRFLDVRGFWDEALRRNEQAKEAALRGKRIDLLPQLHQAAGEIYLRRGEYAKAEKAFRSVLTHYGDIVNTDVADATRRLGSIALERENLTKAKRLYSQSLEISRQLHLDASIADNLHNLALVAQLEEKPDEAIKLYGESLRLSERAGDQRGAAVSLHQLGVVSREQGNYDEARNYFERSLSIKRSLGYREGMADTLHQLGLLYRTLGEKQQAAQPFQQALTIYEELQSPAAAVAASDLATLTTPARAKVSAKRAPSRKRMTAKATKSPAKKSAIKKGAAKKRRVAGISSLFGGPRRKGSGRMGGRFGPHSRKSFR